MLLKLPGIAARFYTRGRSAFSRRSRRASSTFAHDCETTTIPSAASIQGNEAGLPVEYQSVRPER